MRLHAASRRAVAARLTTWRVHCKEVDEVSTGVPLSRFAFDSTSLYIQCRIQRQRSVSIVLKPVTLGAAWREWQYRIKTVEGLNGSLLIYVEHGCMMGWVQIQPNDVGGLIFEFRTDTTEHRAL